MGDGPDRFYLEQKVINLGLTGNVSFLGQLTSRELIEKMRKAWLFALLSDKEGLGVAFIEAQACGLPCIGPKAGGVPEVIIDGLTGFLIDFNTFNSEQIAAEKAIQLIKNNELRKHFSMAAISRARTHFDERISFSRLEEAIQNAVGTA